MEDILQGERIQEYQLFGKQQGSWILISKGTSVGHKRIELVNGMYDGIKLSVLQSVGKAYIRQMVCYGK